MEYGSKPPDGAGAPWYQQRMTTFTRIDELQNARLVEVSLRGARFTDCDLTGVVMRAVEIGEVEVSQGGCELTGGHGLVERLPKRGAGVV